MESKNKKSPNLISAYRTESSEVFSRPVNSKPPIVNQRKSQPLPQKPNKILRRRIKRNSKSESSYAKVKILQVGYSKWKGYATQCACGSITLVISESNLIEKAKRNIIIVDTGVPSFSKKLLDSLKKEKISPQEVSYVISTHSDIDHIGNLNLFPEAIFIAGSDIIKKDVFIDFFEKRYTVDENVKIIATPGHDSKSISVIAKTEQGIVAIVGDLFEKERDWKEEGTWEPWSQDPVSQMKNRSQIWKIADYIIPGHGNIFKVDKTVDIQSLDKNRIEKNK